MYIAARIRIISLNINSTNTLLNFLFRFAEVIISIIETIFLFVSEILDDLTQIYLCLFKLN